MKHNSDTAKAAKVAFEFAKQQKLAAGASDALRKLLGNQLEGAISEEDQAILYKTEKILDSICNKHSLHDAMAWIAMHC